MHIAGRPEASLLTDGAFGDLTYSGWRRSCARACHQTSKFGISSRANLRSSIAAAIMIRTMPCRNSIVRHRAARQCSSAHTVGIDDKRSRSSWDLRAQQFRHAPPPAAARTRRVGPSSGFAGEVGKRDTSSCGLRAASMPCKEIA